MIVVGFCYFDASNFDPFTLEQYVENGISYQGGWAGVFQATSLCYFSYMGFDFMTILTEDAKNPLRNIPISLVGTILILISIYVTTAISLYGVYPLNLVSNPDTAVAEVYELKGLGWMSEIVTIAAFFGISISIFTGMIAIPRLCQELAKDGLLFSFFREVDSKNVPVKGSWIVGIFIALFTFPFYVSQLSSFASLSNLIANILVCETLISLRIRREQTELYESTFERVEKFIHAFSIATFLLCLSIANGWSTYLNVIFGLASFALFIYLCTIK